MLSQAIVLIVHRETKQRVEMEYTMSIPAVCFEQYILYSITVWNPYQITDIASLL